MAPRWPNDILRDRMVLIPGMPTIFGGIHETWENNGTQWTFRGAIGPYGAIREVAAVYDPARHVTVAIQRSGAGMHFYVQAGSSRWASTPADWCSAAASTA